MAIEREIKLTADVDLVLPDLFDVLPGATVGRASVVQLDAIYYDTPNLSMARSGVTLRARTGEPGPTWTLKVPVPSTGPALSRHEYTFDAPLGPVPLQARHASLAYVRSQNLDPVVRLHTRRIQFALEDGGETLAVVCDDFVVSEGAVQPDASFREIEVEFVAERVKPKAVQAIKSCLLVAGCRDDGPPVAKPVRALGPRALAAPDVTIEHIDKQATTKLLIQHIVAQSLVPLIERHAGVWLGEDVEELHQFRVAARRLRSDLRTFAPLLDRGWTTWVRDELAWLGGEVGMGRDIDVMSAHLRSRMATLPADDAGSVARLLHRLDETAIEGRQHVTRALSSDRYIALLDVLVVASHAPQFASEPTGVAEQAARGIIVDLVKRPWERLSSAVDALEPDSPDAAFHEVRIRAKRARYAAEAVEPLFGSEARRFASRIADVQSVLGDHQDTTVAEAWLRQAARAVPSVRLVVGELVALERLERARLPRAVPVGVDEGIATEVEDVAEIAQALHGQTATPGGRPRGAAVDRRDRTQSPDATRRSP